MTTFPDYIPQSKSPLPPWETLPTMYDLPSDNPEEPGLPDDFHFLQPLLLYLTFQPTNWNPQLVYSAADLNLYYDVQHPLWYKRPDWFGVVGVEKLYKGEDLRLSYVTWQERANPFVVVELLSPGTEDEDLGISETIADQPPRKWEVYERILRIPYYIVFSRYTNEMKAFELVGDRYQLINLIDRRVPMPELGLSLGIWTGAFRDIHRLWLRWFTLEGELIPEPTEEALAATERAIIAERETREAQQQTREAQQQAEQAKIKAAQLAERLRQLGVNPDELV
jgi:Uma2 family endonuclease